MSIRTLPLFRFDPGWLFIVAGLTICAAGIILPAQQNLDGLQRQLEALRQEELRAIARLGAHAQFLDELDRLEPGLIKRLAAAQLNVVPEGDTPLLLASAPTSPLTDWIDSTVDADIRPPPIRPVSLLGQMASGPRRLWMFAGGIMCVFVGVLLGPSPIRPAANPKLQSLAHAMLEPDEPVVGEVDDEAPAAIEEMPGDIEEAPGDTQDSSIACDDRPAI